MSCLDRKANLSSCYTESQSGEQTARAREARPDLVMVLVAFWSPFPVWWRSGVQIHRP